MNQKLDIKVIKKPESKTENVLHCRKLCIREKILTKLLGAKNNLMVLMPSGIVKTINITDVEEGDADNG